MGSNDSQSRSLSRRALLGNIGVGTAAALAGCTIQPSSEESLSPDERIAQLEAELAETRAENATLRRQLASANLWGFDQSTIDALQQTADSWTDSVVVIDVITEDGLWSVGTGWVYDDGIIATNAHVAVPRRLPDEHSIVKYNVWDREGHRDDGALMGYTYGRDKIFDDREDIAFLAVSDSITGGRRMDHGVSRDLTPDEPLVQIGHPYSLEFWTASVGPFISQREPFFASNVPGQPGVSGSPVIDLEGDIVGMTWGGQYVRRQQRHPSDQPELSDGLVMPAFETAMNGMHSYMHRIETAADTLI